MTNYERNQHRRGQHAEGDHCRGQVSQDLSAKRVSIDRTPCHAVEDVVMRSDNYRDDKEYECGEDEISRCPSEGAQESAIPLPLDNSCGQGEVAPDHRAPQPEEGQDQGQVEERSEITRSGV